MDSICDRLAFSSIKSSEEEYDVLVATYSKIIQEIQENHQKHQINQNHQNQINQNKKEGFVNELYNLLKRYYNSFVRDMHLKDKKFINTEIIQENTVKYINDYENSCENSCENIVVNYLDTAKKVLEAILEALDYDSKTEINQTN